MVENATENIFNKRLIDAKDRVNRLRIKYDEASDIYPNTTMSTKATNEQFDPEGWVDRIVDLKQEIYIAEIELKNTQEAYDEWFGTEGEHLPK